MANEKRLISVDEWDSFFAEHIYNRRFRNEYEQGYTDALDRVDDWMDVHPTVDAVEVVHGRWVEIPSLIGLPWKVRCDHSGCPQDYKHNYCPNCGAKMDGDGNESA